MGSERVAIMIDGANLAYAAAHLFAGERRQAALRRILTHLPAKACGREGQLVGYDAFFIDNPTFRSIADEIDGIGVQAHFVIAPPLRPGERGSRADDTALKQHAVERVEEYDTLVLVTNDGDFVSTVEMLQGNGCRVVIGSLEGHAARGNIRTSHELHLAADAILPLFPLSEQKDQMGETAPASLELYRGEQSLGIHLVSNAVCEVGRRSERRKTDPDIDFRDADSENITSRHHLALRFIGNGHCIVQVHVDCSRPTWLQGVPLFPGECALYQVGEELTLGDAENGFRLVLAAAESG